ncbi:MAG TPA: spore coat U domain-containing protein [Steroidobacteraceae bacterium]|nr:spore coat U domain-containing protein [Steroidobacteraceae bacterium]
MKALPRAHLILSLLVLAAAGCLAPRTSHANVVCTITGGTYTPLNFGGADTASGTIGYTCTGYNSPGTYTICAGLGNASYPGSNTQPEMQGPTTIGFNLYTNATFTTLWTSSNPLQGTLTVPTGNGVKVSGTLSYYGLIAAGQGWPAGIYTASFYNTVLGGMSGGTCQESAGAISGLDGTLTVTDVVTATCSVTATNVDLGSVASGTTNVAGSGTITVECASGQKYYLGLAPSDGSTTGAGTMTGSAGNTSKIPYQLYQNAGHTTVWGNTATQNSQGNGEGGTGSGSTQPYTVYVLVPGTNYTADTYSDTVTVTVNY